MRQALEIFPSSAAKLRREVLCLMTFWLKLLTGNFVGIRLDLMVGDVFPSTRSSLFWARALSDQVETSSHKISSVLVCPVKKVYVIASRRRFISHILTALVERG